MSADFLANFPKHYMVLGSTACGIHGLRFTRQVNLVECKSCKESWQYIEDKIAQDRLLHTAQREVST